MTIISNILPKEIINHIYEFVNGNQQLNKERMLHEIKWSKVRLTIEDLQAWKEDIYEPDDANLPFSLLQDYSEEVFEAEPDCVGGQLYLFTSWSYSMTEFKKIKNRYEDLGWDSGFDL